MIEFLVSDYSNLFTIGLIATSLLFIAIVYYKIFEAFCWKNHTKRITMERIFIVLSLVAMICFAIAKWSDYRYRQIQTWNALDYSADITKSK